MKLLFAVSYYHPHLSGLTIAARNRAEGMAARGHSLTVVASRHRDDLPLNESIAGVRVVRIPIRWRLSKGVVMERYGSRLREELSAHDALVQFLPASPLEARAAARAAGHTGKPLILDYACDIRLPGGLPSRVVERVALAGHRLAARKAKALIVSTREYADGSPFASKFRDKLRIVPLTIRVREPQAREREEWRARHAPHGEQLIGFAGRMATEKGLEVLIAAVGRLLGDGRNVRLLLAGEVANVIGEEAYRERILAGLNRLQDRAVLLGPQHPDLAGFYSACDVLVLPSLNRTESFGMVQVEAMRCGTPVVASNLPGVREAVKETGMGRLAEPGNATALAEAIADVLDHSESYRERRTAATERFSEARSLDAFEALFREVLA